LEVGTGFHPELTGRENIYLNGAILGMTRREIARKFDEIVAFAEIEKFLDTAVKHYSSGMYMRLAFAVAAHLEPEILVVDEVLAVGDVAFQQKCIGKMGDVARCGRTVLFVSHQMNQIRRLCQQSLWVDGGRARKLGPTIEVVSAYEESTASFNGRTGGAERENQDACFVGWNILYPKQQTANVLYGTGPVALRFVLHVRRSLPRCHHGIALFTGDGHLVWGTDASNVAFEPGTYDLIYKLSALPLRPSAYSWRVSLYGEKGLIDAWDCIPALIVATEPLTHSRDEWAGILNMPYEFTPKLCERRS
jgi:lipopolysaccharide transport system ATP-binding protein